MSVPEAGEKYFGLSRNGSYDAAKLNACAEAALQEHKGKGANNEKRTAQACPQA
jgi:hypothetical protein